MSDIDVKMRGAVPTDQHPRFRGVQLTFIISLNSQSRLVT